MIFSQKRNLCREVYSRPPVYQIWRIYLDLWGHDCKKWVWPTFGCKLGQIDPFLMQLSLDMLCHLLNVYTKFQIDISKHVEKKSGKPGRTDRRTDGHCHGIIRPFFKRAYKKEYLLCHVSIKDVLCCWCNVKLVSANRNKYIRFILITSVSNALNHYPCPYPFKPQKLHTCISRQNNSLCAWCLWDDISLHAR